MTETVDQAQAQPLRAPAGIIEDARSWRWPTVKVFRKLGITSRRKLKEALKPQTAPSEG
jgi:hypothetical protein